MDNFTFNHIVWNPSGSNTYSNTTISVKEELHLYPGDILHLNNVRLEMGKDAKIIVERGAELNLVGTTITTTSCGGYVWEGIEVWGSGDFIFQDMIPSINGTTGILYMNNSKLENADEAISVTKKTGLGFFEIDKSYNGGYINVLNSTFLNNYTSINLWPYKNCEDSLDSPSPCSNCFYYINRSRVRANNFICNAPMRDARYTMTTDQGLTFRLGVNHFVYMNNTFNIMFDNNDFRNLYNTPPVQYRGTGVKIIHSSVEVIQSIAVKGFRGLTVGVMSNADNSACKITKVSKNNFISCQVAIDANSTRLIVSENTISIPNTSSKLITQGIITRNCKDFDINSNSINGLSTGKKYGILLKNNKTGFAKNNFLNGLYTGTQSENLNNAIQINCNTYQNQKYSIVVPNGKIGAQGKINASAGNTFIDVCKSTSNNVNHIKSNVALDYYHIGVNDIPNCITSNVNLKTAWGSPDCININPNPCTPTCTKNKYLQIINTAILQGDLNEVNVQKSKMSIELLNIEGGYDVYLNYLDSVSTNDLEAAKILASTYLTEGKYQDLEEKLNIIQQSETEEGSSFVNLMNIFKEAKIGGRDFHELNGEEVLQLNNLAQNDTTTAGYIAEGILYQLYGYEYDHNPIDMELGSRTALAYEPLFDEILLFPNPAKESISINSNKETFKSVKIYNMQGALVYSAILNNKNCRINTQNFSVGIYYAKLELENSIISRKFIIE